MKLANIALGLTVLSGLTLTACAKNDSNGQPMSPAPASSSSAPASAPGPIPAKDAQPVVNQQHVTASDSDSTKLVENLKPGELKLQLVSPELASRLATDQDLVIINGVVQNADPSLSNQIMCFFEDNSNSQFSKGDKFEVILVEKGEKNNSQRFYIYLHKTDVPLSVRQSIGCRIPGLTHKFTVAELKKAVKNMFEAPLQTEQSED